MKPYVKMMLMNAGNGGNDRRDSSRRSPRGEYDGGGRMEGGRRDGGRMEYDPDMEGGERGYQERSRMGGGYEVDSRFRDRRGREHYDNGRFAPMPGRRGRRSPRSEGGNMEMNGYDGGDMRGGYDGGRNEMRQENNRGGRSDMRGECRGGRSEMRGEYGEMEDDEDMTSDFWPYPPIIPPYGGGGTMNMIGFDREIGNDYRMEATHKNQDEMKHQRSEMQNGGASSNVEFNHETAKEWTSSMHNEDGTKGPHWTMDQVKQVMAQRGIKQDPAVFWAILNAMYSDYCAVFKKHGVNNMDFYVDMTNAWLNDKDAVKDKAGAYYEYVVKH